MTDIVKQLEAKLAQRTEEGDWWRDTDALTNLRESIEREDLFNLSPNRELTRVTIADRNGDPVHLRGATSVVARIRKRIGSVDIDRQIMCEFVDRDKGIIQFEMPYALGEVDIEFTIQGPDRTITVRKGSP